MYAVSFQVTEYTGRRDAVVDLLNKIPGVRCPTPTVLSLCITTYDGPNTHRVTQGAFYAFFDVSSFGIPSAEIASKILHEGG